MSNAASTPYLGLEAIDSESRELNVVIDTPKGSRNKFAYDEKVRLFKLSGVLPAGASFPFDFGFIPSTVGGDGDPLDVLLLDRRACLHWLLGAFSSDWRDRRKAN